MKKQVLALGLIFTLSVAVTNCSRDEAEPITNNTHKENNKNEPTRSDILSGNTAPTPNVGNVGDYYFDQSTQTLYGPKKADGWGNPTTLKGADLSKIITGAGTPTLDTGKVGDFYIDKTNGILYGPKTDKGWEKHESSTKKGDEPAIDKGNETPIKNSDYTLSQNKQTLVKWLNKETSSLDMQSNPELQNVTNIGSSAFQSGSLNQIILPNHLKEIGSNAFSYNKLTSINIPNSVKTISDHAFANNKLTNVNIPNSVTSISAFAFSHNKLTSVNIPNSVKTIGNLAFNENQLTSVNIPNSVTNIDKGVFMNNKLTSVNIPNSVTSIGDNAFYNNKLTSVNIPNSIKTIGDGAFTINQLTSVNIPNSVVTIGDGAFYVYFQLSNITIHAITPPNTYGDALKGIPSSTKIYVPAQSINAYKTTGEWSKYADRIFPIQ